jgi:hypothetical protein
MKTSKNIAATLVSASLIGLVGFAYAQTGTPSTGAAGSVDTTAQPMQNQPADTTTTPVNPAAQPGTGSGTTMGAPGTTIEQPAAGTGSGNTMGAPGMTTGTTGTTGMQTERPMRADRN